MKGDISNDTGVTLVSYTTNVTKGWSCNGRSGGGMSSMMEEEISNDDDEHPPNGKANGSIAYDPTRANIKFNVLKNKRFVGPKKNVTIENQTLRTSNGYSSYHPNGIVRSLSLSATALDEEDRCSARLGFRQSKFNKTFGKRNFEKRELFMILALGLVDFIGFCSMSVMAPFFPNEAAKKDMDVSHSGYVFSFYALIMFLVSPLFGKILPYVGTKFMFMAGVFVTAVCNILFGMLPLIRSNTQFAIFCFVVRGVEAIGAGAFSTASFIYIIHVFPDNISAVLGVMETFAGLGMSIGPALGGILYSIGGFSLPFYTLGVLMIAVLPLYHYILPTVCSNRNTKPTGSLFRLFKVPSISVIFLVVVVSSNAWSFLDPTLEPHLRHLNLLSQHMGLVFLSFSAVYAISSPIWGYIGDKYNNHWSMMAVGLVITAFALVLLGPSPVFRNMPNTLWLNMLALCILAIAVSLTLAPSFKALVECAIEKDFGDSLSTYSVVAGLWSSAYSLGDMTGPALGGLLLEKFNFSVCTTTMAILALSTAAICVLYFGIIDDYPKKTEYSTLHPLLRKDKMAYYGALSNSSSAITITLTNSGACEV